MNHQAAVQERVSSLLIPESKRMLALPRHFGRLMVYVERHVYDWMGQLAPDYNGAYWEFYELSNSGFYMTPRGKERIRITVENGFDEEVSAEVAGIIACLFAYSHLSFSFEVIADHFHALREFALDHADAATILRAID